MKVYMYVTNDEYELPIYVETNIHVLAKKIGVNVNTIQSSLSRIKKGKRKKSRYAVVEIEDEGEGMDDEFIPITKIRKKKVKKT